MPPSPRPLRAVDLFCGAGGTSTGLALAAERLGLEVDLLAVNHWATAIETHRRNHPWARHLCKSLHEVNPREAVPDGRLQLLIAAPECVFHSVARGGRPINDQMRMSAWQIVDWLSALYVERVLIENVREFCFPAHTTVLSKRGVIPIEEIVAGDEVWTHNARWKPVIATRRRISSTVRLKGYGNTIVETTPNHEFYARQIATEITRSGRYGRHKRRLLEPEWVRADCLADKDYNTTYTVQYSGYAWATPPALPRYWMRMPATFGIDPTSPEFFYMLGRWLGDGWIHKRKGRQAIVRICAEKTEADDLQAKLLKTGLRWRRHPHSPTVDVFDLAAQSSRILGRWLVANFGVYAHRKTLPAWIYGATEQQRWALVEGYHDADGHEQGDGTVCAISVSRCLAVGMRLLLQSLGVAASLSSTEPHVQPGIKDSSHPMNCREAFSISWRRTTAWEKGMRTELHLWAGVHEVAPGRDNVEVVNITVADDHSFIADGQVVHNCD